MGWSGQEYWGKERWGMQIAVWNSLIFPLKPFRYSEISQWCGLIRVFHSLCWALNRLFPPGDHILQFWGIFNSTLSSLFSPVLSFWTLLFEYWTLLDWFSNFPIFLLFSIPLFLFYFLEYFLNFIFQCFDFIFENNLFI